MKTTKAGQTTGEQTISVWITPDMAQQLQGLAEAQGHGDISIIANQALERAMLRHKAGLPIGGE